MSRPSPSRAAQAELEDAMRRVPEKCSPYLGTVMDLAVRYAMPIAAAKILEVVPEELREKVAYAAADSAVSAAAVVGSIFTASATKEIFGWGNNFNVNRSARSDARIKSLLQKAEGQLSGIEESRMGEPKYASWPGYEGPWARFDSGPHVQVPLAFIADLVTAAHAESEDPHTRPDGSLSDAQWRALKAANEGLRDFMETVEPMHIGYQFSLGPVAAVHHGLYFGESSGPQGGLVIEVMNRRFGPADDVVSFIAPSTLLSFLRRTHSNGQNGLLVYKYSRSVPMSVALARAEYAVGRFNYNVVRHNCENFVSWVLMNNDSNSTCVGFKTTIAGRAKGLLRVRSSRVLSAGGRRRSGGRKRPASRPISRRKSAARRSRRSMRASRNK